jgi:hypothetical protein
MRCCELLLALCAAGCASSSGWEPPPALSIPTPPLAMPESPLSGPSAGPSAAPVPDPPPAPEPSAPPAPLPPEVTITLDAPYKMGERVNQKTYQAQLEDIRDRRHWNSGGMGELLAELPGPVGHPDPRVTVTIERVDGPHSAKNLQRIARKHHWINVVRCYRLGSYKDPHLRGWTKGRFDLSARGKAKGRKLLDTKLKDRDVAKCMVDKLSEVPFGGAKRGSRVWVEMKVSPGDDPMPPPEDELISGDGTLTLEAMRAGVEAGRSEIEACYRAAFDYAPGLWGRLILRFHLTEHGKLDEVFEVGSRFPDRRVAQCVARAARRFTFDKPEGGEIRFFVPLRMSTARADSARPEPAP